MSPSDESSSPQPAGATPPPILDYGHARPRVWGDRISLCISALVTGCIGLVLSVALVELEIRNWPNFGMVIAIVPMGLVAASFLMISFTAIKAAIYDAGQPRRGSTANNSPTE